MSDQSASVRASRRPRETTEQCGAGGAGGGGPDLQAILDWSQPAGGSACVGEPAERPVNNKEQKGAPVQRQPGNADRAAAASMSVAVLGAGGTMGLPIARNLARAGMVVRGWN